MQFVLVMFWIFGSSGSRSRSRAFVGTRDSDFGINLGAGRVFDIWQPWQHPVKVMAVPCCNL
jgi:hypothetical protein